MKYFLLGVFFFSLIISACIGFFWLLVVFPEFVLSSMIIGTVLICLFKSAKWFRRHSKEIYEEFEDLGKLFASLFKRKK